MQPLPASSSGMEPSDDEQDQVQDMVGTLPASSSTGLVNEEQEEVSQEMNVLSTECFWPTLFQKKADQSWPLLLHGVLLYLTDLLRKTSSAKKFMKSTEVVDAVSDIAENRLKDAVSRGVEHKDWADLIKLVRHKNPQMASVAIGVPIYLKEAVVQAWNQQYHGDSHKILLKAMDELHKLPPDRNYAKIIPIAQSSGTGKSKTVDRCGLERILLPMCLRHDLGPDSFAYPLPDQQVRKHLVAAPATGEVDKCKQYLERFLAALFKSAKSLTKNLFPDEGKKTSYVKMAKAFHRHFEKESDRGDFYDSVVQLATRGLSKNTWECFKELQDLLMKRCSNWPVVICPILISIDEVHVLYDRRSEDRDSNSTLYSLFKSVLGGGILYSLGVICMSTTSHVATMAPSKDISDSLRERGDEISLPAPFTELPFDVHIIADPLVPGRMDLSSVGSLEFTAKFGRPLFYATFLSHEGKQETHKMMKIVMEKLSGCSWPPDNRATLNLSTIAILSSRLLLDLSPATAHARRYEQNLVRSHLRMLYSVHEDRQTIVTGSSPEPLVAEASAHMMHYILPDGKPYMDLWALMGEFVDHGLASQGAIGGLIGRTLSICAMDRAIGCTSNERAVCELRYQTPVVVTDYYKALLTDEAWAELRQSIPANRAELSSTSAKKTFEEAFKNAYFHFSHYGQANDASSIDMRCAWAYWLRGTAISCQPNQELTDRMMPIYFPDLGKVSPTTMSANLDQDKTGHSINPVHVGIQSAEDLSIFPPGTKLPYIAAVHCYALTQDQGISVVTLSEHDLRTQKTDEVAPCYQIDFRGLDAYANLTDANKATIRGMINRSKNTVFEDHPRNYGVASVRRMLPVLTKDPSATEWFGGYLSTSPELDATSSAKGSSSKSEELPPSKRLRRDSTSYQPVAGPSNTSFQPKWAHKKESSKSNKSRRKKH